MLAHGAIDGKHGRTNLIRPVDTARSRSRLLDSRVNGERRTAGECRYAEKLPAGSHRVQERMRVPPTVEGKFLDQAERDHMAHIDL